MTLFISGTLLAIAVTVFNHRVFAVHLRRHHPDVYRALTGEEARMRTSRLISDVTEDMQRFRTQGDDLGDPRLALLRRISRGLTKASVGCFVGMGAVIALYVALTVARQR